MNLEKPNFELKGKAGVQTFMISDSSPIRNISNLNNNSAERNNFKNTSSFQKRVKVEIASITIRAKKPDKSKSLLKEKRKSIKTSSPSKKLSNSIKRDCKSSQNLYLISASRNQKTISEKKFPFEGTPKKKVTPFPIKGNKRHSTKLNKKDLSKRTPVDIPKGSTFTENVKNAEKMLRSSQNLELAKNEDSTNSSESQKVKNVLENYYKEE